MPRAARSQRLHVECERIKLPPRPKSGLARAIQGAAVQIDRIFYPLAYRVSIESEDSSNASVVTFHVRFGTPPGISVRSIELWPRTRHPRAADLRFPLAAYLEVVEHVIAHVVFTPAIYEILDGGAILAPDGANVRAPIDGKAPERRRRQPLNEKDMREVARIYRANPRRPKKAVAETRGVSERTAARQISDTRAAGVLGPALKNRPGELPPARKSLAN